MGKGINAVNGLTKKSIMIGALLLGSAAMKAATAVKNDVNTNNTEIISKEGAEAVKAARLQEISLASVPSVHNPKLDKTLQKYIESNEDRDYINSILSNVYKDNGTFLGSALLQHEIDFQHLYAFISGNTNVMIKNGINPSLGKEIQGFGSKFYATVTPNKDKIENWLNGHYNPVLINNLKFSHKPTAEEVNTRLDDIAKTKAGFNQDNIAEYYAYSNDFLRNKINMKKDTQSMSDLIAYKMFLIDKILFFKEVRGAGVFKLGRFENGNKSIVDYYNDWMDSVRPSGN